MQGNLVPLGAGATFPLTKERILVGRAPVCDVHLDDHMVSSRHCLLSFDGTAWEVEDLGSKNGTAVNNVRVKKAVLHPGDTLTLARDSRFRIEYNPAAAKAAAGHGKDEIDVDEVLSAYRDQLVHGGPGIKTHHADEHTWVG
jgi:pSer/pThr/pTyr-binding forkhead associated (FHA) protein